MVAYPHMRLCLCDAYKCPQETPRVEEISERQGKREESEEEEEEESLDASLDGGGTSHREIDGTTELIVGRGKIRASIHTWGRERDPPRYSLLSSVCRSFRSSSWRKHFALSLASLSREQGLICYFPCPMQLETKQIWLFVL